MTTLEVPEVVDLFAGPGGWSEALKAGGVSELGIEWDKHAAATAVAAGHARLVGDVSLVDPSVYQGVVGLAGSPPCQTFSAAAGKGRGRSHLDALRDAARLVGAGKTPQEAVAEVEDDALDERSVLVLEPLRWARALSPEWVALEQVPAVFPIWEAVAVELRTLGYDVWTSKVVAADYGCPQTRRRALLLASRVKPVSAPVATHAKEPDGTLFGSTLLPWVTMADALGWSSAPVGSRVWSYIPEDRDGTDGSLVTTDDPAALPSWVREKPSPTIVGSFRPDMVAPPVTRTDPTKPRQKAPGAVQVSVEEAGVLQGFPASYPWQGAKGRRFQQVGNAIPVQLAAAALAAVR